MTQVLDHPARTLMPLGRYEWERLLRRIVMPPQHKLVALLLATWADPDGSRVRPGTALLAASMGRSQHTASNVMRSLRREWGLIEQVSRGGGRGGNGKTATYRLTIPTDLLDRYVLLDPDGRDSSATQGSGQPEVSAEVQGSDGYECDDESPDVQGSDQSPCTPVDNSVPSEVLPSGQSNGHAPIDRKSDAVTDRLTGSSRRLTGSSALATTTHVTNHLKTTNTAVTHELDHRPREPEPTSPSDLGGGVGEVPGQRPTLDDLLPLSKSPKPALGPKCAHGLSAALADDGTPRCPHCRRGLPATGRKRDPP